MTEPNGGKMNLMIVDDGILMVEPMSRTQEENVYNVKRKVIAKA